jgi:hypothetical protein
MVRYFTGPLPTPLGGPFHDSESSPGRLYMRVIGVSAMIVSCEQV